ncbi:MAG: hypothetical protein ACTSWY_13550 [Promethearchaeota archaeon]
MNIIEKKGIGKIPVEFLRNLPGWKNAPVPICMNGDYRALSWCCIPGESLTFGYKCQRDKRLKEIGMSRKKITGIRIIHVSDPSVTAVCAEEGAHRGM